MEKIRHQFLKDTSIELPTIKKERLELELKQKAPLKPNYINCKSILNSLTDSQNLNNHKK